VHSHAAADHTQLLLPLLLLLLLLLPCISTTGCLLLMSALA
jgi:hypothetical protein